MARTTAGKGGRRDRATETPAEADPRDPAARPAPEGAAESLLPSDPAGDAAQDPATQPAASDPPSSAEPEPVLPEITAEGAETLNEPLRPAGAVPPPAPPAARRGGGGVLAGAVLGGIAAAALGAGAVLVLLPQGWRGVDGTALEARLRALETRQPPPTVSPQEMDDALAPLAERLAALEAALPGLAPLSALDSAAPDLAALEARLAALEAEAPAARLERIEGELAARIEARLEAALAAGLATQEAGAEALETARAAVAEAESRVAARAALADLAAAAVTGAPAGAALEALAAATADLPPALAPFRTGLPTLLALQRDFPAAARAALAAMPAGEGDSIGERLLTLLRAQTGARSLTPREGDDPDAVLSRAEALVRGGDLAGALSELDTLPEAARPAMAEWRARAEIRLAALAALDELTARLGTH